MAGASLTARVLEWRAGGELSKSGNHEIFVRRTAGAPPLLLFLHGFPSSSYDWRGVLSLLQGRASLALDFLGFGLSEKPPDLLNSLFEQADIVEHLVGSGGGPVVIVAHDMGTSVACELLARDLEGGLSFPIDAALLFNAGMIVDRASLTWAQRALRSPVGGVVAAFSSRRLFTREFSRLFSSAHPLTEEEAEDQWVLWRRAGGARIAHRLIHYIDERVAHGDRWLGAIRDWPGRLQLAWGMHDPVATVNVLEGLRELRPGVPVAELRDLAHYPQIEQPSAIATLIEEVTADFI